MQKNNISTSKQRVKHPFAGQNAQQSFYIEIIFSNQKRGKHDITEENACGFSCASDLLNVFIQHRCNQSCHTMLFQ